MQFFFQKTKKLNQQQSLYPIIKQKNQKNSKQTIKRQYSIVYKNKKKIPFQLIILNSQSFTKQSMWYLNYCSPFIYQTDGTIKTSRFIMYITLLVLFVCYIIHILIYKAIGKQVAIKAAYTKNEAVDNRRAISYKGMGDREFRMNEKKFKEWFTHYFGMHSVATGAAIMYSPFVPQLVFTIVWAVFFIICSIMNSCQKKGAVKFFFNFFLIICILLDIILLFTAAMGVGASGYDNTQKICYWQR